jgi:uroporphyrinogen decarboxylase
VNRTEAIDRELEAKLPSMLRQGGYIPYTEHYVSPDISWENFLYYRRRVNEYVLKAAKAD